MKNKKAHLIGMHQKNIILGALYFSKGLNEMFDWQVDCNTVIYIAQNCLQCHQDITETLKKTCGVSLVTLLT